MYIDENLSLSDNYCMKSTNLDHISHVKIYINGKKYRFKKYEQMMQIHTRIITIWSVFCEDCLHLLIISRLIWSPDYAIWKAYLVSVSKKFKFYLQIWSVLLPHCNLHGNFQLQIPHEWYDTTFVGQRFTSIYNLQRL